MDPSCYPECQIPVNETLPGLDNRKFCPVNAGMSNSNQLADRTFVVLTMKYTTQAALNELLELLGVFLIVITIKDQFKMPNIVIFYTPTSSRFWEINNKLQASFRFWMKEKHCRGPQIASLTCLCKQDPKKGPCN